MAPSSREPISKSRKNFISEDFVGKSKQLNAYIHIYKHLEYVQDFWAYNSKITIYQGAFFIK